MSIAEENAVCQAIYYTIVYKFTVSIEAQLECLNTKCVSLSTLKVNLISIISLSPLIKATANQLKLATINIVVRMHCSASLASQSPLRKNRDLFVEGTGPRDYCSACYGSFNFRIA